MTPYNDGRCSVCRAPFGEREHALIKEVDAAIDREDVARSREEPHPGDEQLDLFEWGELNERSNS